MTFYATQVNQIYTTHFPDREVIQRVIRAKQLADTQCCSTDTHRMAEEACMSQFHFIRLFRRCYGRTPHQYLTEAKIRFAMRMLGEGSSVTDTCFNLGFESTASFSALFRRYAGCTPSAYRQKSNFQ